MSVMNDTGPHGDPARQANRGRDHYVGTVSGCPACRRLAAVCSPPPVLGDAPPRKTHVPPHGGPRCRTRHVLHGR